MNNYDYNYFNYADIKRLLPKDLININRKKIISILFALILIQFS